MKLMKMITPEAARKLAVSYAAYLALPPVRQAGTTELNSIACWGAMLLEAQAATGIQLQDPENVRAIVASARLYYDRLTAGMDYDGKPVEPF